MLASRVDREGRSRSGVLSAVVVFALAAQAGGCSSWRVRDVTEGASGAPPPRAATRLSGHATCLGDCDLRSGHLLKDSGLFDEVYVGGDATKPADLDEIRFVSSRVQTGQPTEPFWQDLIFGIDSAFLVLALPAQGSAWFAGLPLLAVLALELPLFPMYGEWGPPFEVSYGLSVVGHGERVFANYRTTRRIAVEAQLGVVMNDSLDGHLLLGHERLAAATAVLAAAAVSMSDERAVEELFRQLLEDRETLSRIRESLPVDHTPIELAGSITLKTPETPPALRAGMAVLAGEPPEGVLVRREDDHLAMPLPGEKPRLTVRCEVAERPGEDMELWSGAPPKDGRFLLKRTHWGTVKALRIRVEVRGFAPVEERIEGARGAFVAVLEPDATEAR